MSYLWNMNMTTEREQLHNDKDFIIEDTIMHDDGMIEDHIRLRADPEKCGCFYFMKDEEKNDGKYYLYEVGHHWWVVPLIELIEQRYNDESMDEDTWEELYYAGLEQEREFDPEEYR